MELADILHRGSHLIKCTKCVEMEAESTLKYTVMSAVVKSADIIILLHSAGTTM